MNPCPLIWADNPSLDIFLPSTTTIKLINPTNSHSQGGYIPQSLSYGASGGSSFLLYYISSYYYPYLITCHLLPPFPPASSTSFFCRGVLCTGYRHMVDYGPSSARPPLPPGSTLAVPMSKMLLAMTMSLMMLHWVGSSYIQLSPFILSRCTQAYYIKPVFRFLFRVRIYSGAMWCHLGTIAPFSSAY